MSDEFDTLEWLLSGKPVPLVIDGCEFALRQPKPIEVDRLQQVEQRARDAVMRDYRADGLDQEPVSEGQAFMQRAYAESLEELFVTATEAGDTETARQAAEDMERIPRQWPKSLAEERARDYSRKVAYRWIVDTMLEGDRTAWRELTAPDPLERVEVIEAVQKIAALINHDPNLNRRKA